jgi:hypothetical protein
MTAGLGNPKSAPPGKVTGDETLCQYSTGAVETDGSMRGNHEIS